MKRVAFASARAFAHAFRFELRQLHVEPALHCGLLGRRASVDRCGGQVGQARGQLQCMRAPAIRACASVARARSRRTAARGKLRGGVGVEQLFAHLRELAPVADLRHTSREIASRLGRHLDLPVIDNHLLRGNGAKVRFARGGGGRDHVRRGGDLRLCEAALLDFERQAAW